MHVAHGPLLFLDAPVAVKGQMASRVVFFFYQGRQTVSKADACVMEEPISNTIEVYGNDGLLVSGQLQRRTMRESSFRLIKLPTKAQCLNGKPKTRASFFIRCGTLHGMCISPQGLALWRCHVP